MNTRVQILCAMQEVHAYDDNMEKCKIIPITSHSTCCLNASPHDSTNTATASTKLDILKNNIKREDKLFDLFGAKMYVNIIS